LTIGRDYGTSLEVLQGITSSDWIVLNPADSLDEGQSVNVKEVPQKPAQQSAPSAPSNPTAKPVAKAAVPANSGARH